MISRTSSMPVCEAASISITSTWRDSMIAWQWTPSSGISMLGASILPGTLIVEGAGENARGRRLADAAHAGQDIGLMDAARGEGIGERPDHRLLADQVLEPLRAGICARERDRLRRRRRGSGRGIDGKQRIAHRPPLPSRLRSKVWKHLEHSLGRLGLARSCGGDHGEGGRLDKDPPCLVRAASFRT